MAIRRSLLTKDEGYVKHGLVLWMDGIDKGNVSGSWVDKVAGHIFENINGMTLGDNYIGLDAASSQHLRNNTLMAISADFGTIEVVIRDYLKGTIVFFPATYGIAFGIRASTDDIIWTANEYTNKNMVAYTGTPKAFSINAANALIDGNNASYSLGNRWNMSEGNYNYIGCRNYNPAYNYFSGKIHSIRVYNRQLSKNEMLHNQRIDNKRFALGLNIE